METQGLLRNVAEEIRGALQQMPHNEVRVLVDTMLPDHGFAKYRFSEFDSSMAVIAADCWGKVQAELVRVNTDRSHELHYYYHEQTHACMLCLGEREHLPNPIKAMEPGTNTICCAESTFDIPPDTPHGFTLRRGGILYFLLVQTPPLVCNGGDD